MGSYPISYWQERGFAPRRAQDVLRNTKSMSHNFQIATVSPGLLQPSIAIATHRAGELGVLDFEYVRDQQAISRAIGRMHDIVCARFGVKLSGEMPEVLARAIASLPDYVSTVVLTSSRPKELREHVRLLREKKIAALLEA